MNADIAGTDLGTFLSGDPGAESNTIHIDNDLGQAKVNSAVSVVDLRRAAAEAGLWYPRRPASPQATVADHVHSACRGRSWMLRHGSALRDVAEVRLVGPSGSTVITRDERVGSVRRDLIAALDAGAEITQVVLDLADPVTHRESMIVSFDDREGAAVAAEAVLALGRPAAVDIVDQSAMAIVAGFGGLDVYAAGATLFVELADADQSAVSRDTELVENICFESGATAIRECENDNDVALAIETLVTSCVPVLRALRHPLVHDAAVPESELLAHLSAVGAVDRTHGTVLTVIVDGATGRLSCWVAPDAKPATLAALRRELALVAAMSGAALAA